MGVEIGVARSPPSQRLPVRSPPPRFFARHPPRFPRDEHRARRRVRRSRQERDALRSEHRAIVREAHVTPRGATSGRRMQHHQRGVGSRDDADDERARLDRRVARRLRAVRHPRRGDAKRNTSSLPRAGTPPPPRYVQLYAAWTRDARPVGVMLARDSHGTRTSVRVKTTSWRSNAVASVACCSSSTRSGTNETVPRDRSPGVSRRVRRRAFGGVPCFSTADRRRQRRPVAEDARERESPLTARGQRRAASAAASNASGCEHETRYERFRIRSRPSRRFRRLRLGRRRRDVFVSFERERRLDERGGRAVEHLAQSAGDDFGASASSAAQFRALSSPTSRTTSAVTRRPTTKTSSARTPPSRGSTSNPPFDVRHPAEFPKPPLIPTTRRTRLARTQAHVHGDVVRRAGG